MMKGLLWAAFGTGAVVGAIYVVIVLTALLG